MIGTHSRQKPRGFTMTELLAVTSVGAVIVAMVLPSIGFVREQERTVRGLANLQQIGQTIYIFAADNGNRLPYGYFRDAAPNEEPGSREVDWTILLNNFLAGGGDTYEKFAQGPHGNVLLPIFRDPNATYPEDGLYHYAGHPVLMPDKNEWHRSYAITRFRRPHEVFLVADAIQRPTGFIPRTSFATAFAVDRYSLAPAHKPFFSAGDTDNDDPIDPGVNIDPPGLCGEPLANIRWRQKNNTAANLVFADGHSETRPMAQVTKRNIRVDP